eukprot:19467_1
MSNEQKVDLSQLREKVEHEIEKEDHSHDKIATICRTALSSSPPPDNELFWLRLLCCALIHLSQFRSLIAWIAKYSSNNQIQNALLFYKVYCLYELKQNEEAIECVSASKEKGIDIKYLEYQIYYRLGQYDLALKVLSQLEVNADLCVNEMASLIAMDSAQDAIDKYYNSNWDEMFSCDFVFNLATALIVCARVDEAKSFLRTSLTKCTAQEDHYDEEEIAILEILIAYCLFVQGDTAAAHVYYQKHVNIGAIYDRLILQNNCLASQDETKPNGDSLLLFNKLLSRKNEQNFCRFGASEMRKQLNKTYHNKCIILIQNPAQPQERNELEFKALIAKMGKHSPLALDCKISYHLGTQPPQYQQICDVLKHHLSIDYSIKYHLVYVQILIEMNKYRTAIKQIAALRDEEVKYSHKTMQIVLHLCDVLKDKQLKIKCIKECVQYLDQLPAKTDDHVSMLVALQMDLCDLLMDVKQREEAKRIALRLNEKEPQNEVYQAMLLLTAIETKDMELAKQISDKMSIDRDDDSYDAYAVDELLVQIPNVNEDDEVNQFQFEIAPHIELERKRAANRRKRQKKASKLRQKFQENPDLYRDAVNWESKAKKIKNEKQIRKKKAKNKQFEKDKKKHKTGKKKKGFRGAQGGSGQSDKFQVYDIGDPKNKKSGKKNIPQHIKKKRKRG